jgi:hypothetical protein
MENVPRFFNKGKIARKDLPHTTANPLTLKDLAYPQWNRGQDVCASNGSW